MQESEDVSSLRRAGRSLLFHLARLDERSGDWRVLRALRKARAAHLPGAERLIRLLYNPYRYRWYPERRAESLGFVTAYDASLVEIDVTSSLEWSLYAFGGHEIEDVSLLKRLTHPGATVFDVGANVGAFTLPLARLVGPGGAVHAFEPHPGVRERLARNVALNNLRNVTLSPVALGAAPGRAVLYGSTTANQARSSLRPGPGLERELECVIETLDNYVDAARLQRLDLVKIDTEGADYLVLSGARGALGAHKPCVYCEVHPTFMAKFGATPEAMLELLEGLGYDVWRNPLGSRGEPHLTRVRRGQIRIEWAEYWLAVHPGSAERQSPSCC
jgi:FkbM family methyltransferase